MVDLKIKKKTDVRDGMDFVKPSIKNNNNQKPQGINMKVALYIAIIIVVISSIGSCFDNVIVVESERELYAMDTYMTFKVYGKDREKALNEIVSRVQELDEIFSISKNGAISELNKEKSLDDNEEVIELIKTANDISNETDGALDITVYPLMDEWGFVSKQYKIPDDEKIKEILKSVNYNYVNIDDDEITLENDAKVDLGSIVKGYTGDVIADVLKRYNVKYAIASLGGNIEIYKKKPDGKPWKIGVDNPFKENEGDNTTIGDITINDGRDGKAIITSGDYERYFEKDGKRYHHILDPKTGYPVDNGVRSVTIVSENGTFADALSTTLFVLGKDKAKEYWKNHSDEFDYVMVMEDKKIIVSEGLKDDFTTDYECEYVK